MMGLFAECDPVLPFAIPEGLDAHVHWDAQHRGFWIEVPHGRLFYAQDFIRPAVSDRTVAYFLENRQNLPPNTDWAALSAQELAQIEFDNIAWKQDTIQLYGKSFPLPRLTSWYGDAGKSYTYSGIRSEPNPWNKGLLYLKERVEEVAGQTFNSVLLNWYRNGEDHLAWHTDDEKDLGTNPTIASLNFGQPRDFMLRLNEDHACKLTIPLVHGSFLLMAGALQHHWQHCVPKRKKIKASRFNLTFRCIQ